MVSEVTRHLPGIFKSNALVMPAIAIGAVNLLLSVFQDLWRIGGGKMSWAQFELRLKTNALSITGTVLSAYLGTKLVGPNHPVVGVAAGVGAALFFNNYLKPFLLEIWTDDLEKVAISEVNPL